MQFSVGLKVWNSSWFSYNPGSYTGIAPTGGVALIESVDAVEGARKTDTIPVLALRSGKYVFSATHASYASNFHSPYSAVVAPDGSNIGTSRTDYLARKETDLTAAYFVVPNIALSIGIKHAAEARDTVTGLSPRQRLIEAKGKAFIVGASASFPIQGNLRAYGQLGYGPTRLKTELVGLDSNTSKGRYLSSELGVSYALTVVDPYVKGAYVGLGFRSQTITTTGVGPGYLEPRDYRDIKDGVVFSLTIAI
jgi:hypothetical protein